MIIVLKQNAPEVQVREFCHELQDMACRSTIPRAVRATFWPDRRHQAVAESWVLANPVVETCRRVTEPYKKANRKFHPDDSVIDVDGVKIGGGNLRSLQAPAALRARSRSPTAHSA